MINIVPVFSNFCDFVGISDIRGVGRRIVGLVHKPVPGVEKPSYSEKEACLSVGVTGDFDNAVGNGKMFPFGRQYETMVAKGLLQGNFFGAECLDEVLAFFTEYRVVGADVAVIRVDFTERIMDRDHDDKGVNTSQPLPPTIAKCDVYRVDPGGDLQKKSKELSPGVAKSREIGIDDVFVTI